MPKKDKLLAIVGPTASGKSELAVSLAKKFNGEIISADSRQIYAGMDIGTGKVEGAWKKIRGRKIYVYKGIPHYCIDFLSPKKQFSAGLFQRQAQKAIDDILERGKLPILCGGTGHWIDAVVLGQKLPEVKPNPALRRKLEKLSPEKLFIRLQKLDPARAKNIDRFNKRRLIRALEIVMSTGQPVPALNSKPSPYECLWLGLLWPQEALYKRIDSRLTERLSQGMVKEISQLHKQGLSWKKLFDFGLEYRYVGQYLQKKLTHDEMIEQLGYAIKHYAKRQMTWWKRNRNIQWLKTPFKQADKLTKKFILG
ncbi:MAG: tRNA (adenosine(37)-N6)-dimethylallyltransferase MiaA [Patescibacteria group bacterium]|nr:tRNA (adenosine(37)-N6)-dimethylallyltransferase MiaA [Patescibacteria group bacterium]